MGYINNMRLASRALTVQRYTEQHNNNIMRTIVCVVLPARFVKKDKTVILSILIFSTIERLHCLFGSHAVCTSG